MVECYRDGDDGETYVDTYHIGATLNKATAEELCTKIRDEMELKKRMAATSLTTHNTFIRTQLATHYNGASLWALPMEDQFRITSTAPRVTYGPTWPDVRVVELDQL